MAWSKVDKTYNKPLMWWFHKLLCEFWWSFVWNGKHISKYYFHLNKMIKLGFNLYGQKI